MKRLDYECRNAEQLSTTFANEVAAGRLFVPGDWDVEPFTRVEVSFHVPSLPQPLRVQGEVVMVTSKTQARTTGAPSGVGLILDPVDPDLLKNALSATAMAKKPKAQGHVNERILLSRLRAQHKEMQSKNLFQVLSVPLDAGEEIIRAAFLDLSLNTHPDRFLLYGNAEISREAQEIYIMITEAYETLRDRQRRKKYIQKLGLPEPKLGA